MSSSRPRGMPRTLSRPRCSGTRSTSPTPRTASTCRRTTPCTSGSGSTTPPGRSRCGTRWWSVGTDHLGTLRFVIDPTSGAQTADISDARQLFPATEGRAYFNTAAVGLASRRLADVYRSCEGDGQTRTDVPESRGVPKPDLSGCSTGYDVPATLRPGLVQL